MDAGLVFVIVFVIGVIALAAVLRREDRKGTWDKEGHGENRDREPGPRYRSLEVPPKEPFD